MKKISLLYLVVALFAISCTQEVNDNDYNTYGSISGIVADKTTGEPVPVVNVKLKETGASTVTGSDGSFSFKNLDDDSYTIEISKEGYKDNSANVRVLGGKTTETHLLIERIPAVLTIDRDVLDFGENYSNTTLSFSMVNKNYVDLDWEIVYSCRWIKEIDPIKSVAKLGFGKTQTVVVIIDRDNLLPGDNETVIVVRTSDGASELTVKAKGQQRALPTLNMLETTDLKASSAILHAEITSKGIPEYTARGFVVGDSSMPTKETALSTVPATVTTENAFSVRVGDLNLGSTYYVRAYAENAEGIAYSTNEDKFTTQAVLPTVVTLSATGEDRETKTAILRGSISYEGDPAYTECGFVWSTVYENPTIEEEKVAVSMSGAGDFEKRVTFPDVSQTIYVRAYATNQRGTAYGEPLQVFQTEYIVLSALKLGVQRTDINRTTLLWSDADALCKNSRVANLSDWRLPTKDELFQLYNMKDEIGGFSSSCYWSSTYTPSGSRYYIDFYDGGSGYGTGSRRARCVRSL